MNKREFLTKLRNGLSSLPSKEAQEHILFYDEMIDDRIEEGCTEEEAVNGIGDINSIINQIISQTSADITSTQPKKKIKVWEIAFLVLGSPIWLSLTIAVLAVILSLYISLWAIIFSLWCCFTSLTLCGSFAILSSPVLFFTNQGVMGMLMLGSGLIYLGLSIFLFFACKASTKGSVKLTNKVIHIVKIRLFKRRNTNV